MLAKQRLFFWIVPLVVSCDGFFGPAPTVRATVASIAAPDTVPAAAVFTAAVHVTHGPCQRPLLPQVTYVADTAFLDARVQRDERVFNGLCDADILLGQTFDVAIDARGTGSLVIQPLPLPGTTAPADTVFVAGS